MEIATALIRLRQSALPAPEDLFDDPRASMAPPSRSPQDKDRDRAFDRDRDGGRPERMAAEDVVWFRLSTGRNNNADPKWLIPLICRAGHITKKDIGAIKIFDRETKFEITKEAEARFTAAIKAAAESAPDNDLRIEPAVAPSANRDGPREQRPRAPRDQRGPAPQAREKRAYEPRSPDRPFEPRPQGGKPPYSPRPQEPRSQEPRAYEPRPQAARSDEGGPRERAPRKFAPRDQAPAPKPFAPRPPKDAAAKPWSPVDRPSEADAPRAPKAYKKPYFDKKAAFEGKAPFTKKPKPSKKGKPNG